jgi:hypothetical protein
MEMGSIDRYAQITRAFWEREKRLLGSINNATSLAPA